jgi:hypothetical protein
MCSSSSHESFVPKKIECARDADRIARGKEMSRLMKTPPGADGLVRRSLVLALALAAVGVRAQSYSIDWSTIDGGGGTSTGGVYSVSGTIGQPDAGPAMTGGSFSVTGGFWSLLSVLQTPGSPTLRIFFTGTNTAVVYWPSPSTGFNLQQSGLLPGTNWVASGETVNDNGTNKYIIVSPPTGNRYYRLVHP